MHSLPDSFKKALNLEGPKVQTREPDKLLIFTEKLPTRKQADELLWQKPRKRFVSKLSRKH
jgi:hypothetical protein